MKPGAEQAFSIGLRVAFGAAAAVLTARALFGPLTFPIPVRSPINAEGWLAIAAALLLALRLRPAHKSVAGSPQTSFAAADLWAPVSLAALIVAAFWTSRHDYFLADDFLIVKYAHDFVFDLHRLLTTPGGDGFFRPAGFAFFGLLFRWASFDPLRWHLAGFALHAVNTALVFAILRQMRLARAPAWFAAALFAIHGTRPEAVVWAGGRFDLLATFFVLLSATLFLQFWNDVRRVRWVYWSASLIATVLGILSKESAYAGPPILALLGLTLLWDSSPQRLWTEALWTKTFWKRWALSIAPFFAAAAGLFAYRWVLFGSIGGYLDASGRPQALLLSPVNVIKALLFRIWAVLLFPVDWISIPDLKPGIVLGVAMILYLAALAWITTARVPRRDLVAPLGFVLVASLPPLQQLLIGPDMEKARYLYLPAAGFCWLLAAIAQSMEPGARQAVWAAVLIFNLAALGNNLSAWRFTAQKERQACIAAAACARGAGNRLLAIGLPRTVRGVPLFAWGFEDCVRMELDGAPLTVDMRDTATAVASTSEACVLEWDPATSELRRVR